MFVVASKNIFQQPITKLLCIFANTNVSNSKKGLETNQSYLKIQTFAKFGIKRLLTNLGAVFCCA